LIRTLIVVLASVLPAAGQVKIGAKAGIVTYRERGRSEAMLNACAVMHLDVNSSMRMISDRLDDARVELLSGSALVHVDEIVRQTKITIVVKGVAVPLTTRGLYRFDVDRPRLRVWSGKALSARAGRELALDGVSKPAKFNRDRQDALDRWSERRIVVLARESGMVVRLARERAEAEATAKKTAELENRSRDVMAPDTPGPGRFSGPPNPLPSTRPRICSESAQ
jgi:hypothetical protein